MDIEELIASIADRLQKSASVRTVFGDPIEAHGKTIIPIAVVGYGFGAGGGAPQRDEADGQDAPRSASGGGAGVGIRPRGVLEITKEETRYVPIRPFAPAAIACTSATLVGFALGWFFGRRRRPESP